MHRAAPASVAAGLLVAAAVSALIPVPATRAEDAPDAAWWSARVPISLVLTGGEAGAFQGPDGRTGARHRAALIERLSQRARNGGGVLGALALGWHLQGDAAQDEVDAVHWRALFETSGFTGALMGGPECSLPAMAQPLGGLGELGVPRRPLNVFLAPRHLGSSSPAFLDVQLGGTALRAVTVLDDDDAGRLRDRGEALAQIAVATAFQNLPPTPNRLWIVGTWPRAESTLPSLASAVGRLGPAVVVDVSGNEGVSHAENVVLGAGRPALVVGLGQSGGALGVLDLVPDPRHKTWRASYRRLPLSLAQNLEGVGGVRADGVLAERERAQRNAGLLGTVPVRDDPGARYVGSTACISCHTAIYKSWKRTGHARAMLHLRDVHAAWDPNCVACHVVGWQRPDGGAWHRHASGFRDPATTGYLGGVGCESCHGPGSRHLMDPWNASLFSGQGPNHKGGDLQRCTACHDAVHDPGFLRDFSTHLQTAGHALVPSDRRTVVPQRLLDRLRRAGLAPR